MTHEQASKYSGIGQKVRDALWYSLAVTRHDLADRAYREQYYYTVEALWSLGVSMELIAPTVYGDSL